MGLSRNPFGGAMTVRVGINGFGRIGRNFLRAVKQSKAKVDIVAVNDLTTVDVLAHLLKYDSVMGRLSNKVEVSANGITVDGDEFKIFAERDPKALPWGDLGVDLVIESTGIFTDRDKAAFHLEGGAPFVVVSAPSGGADATFVVGVNEDTFDPTKHKVVSNASCTTNCFVPMIKVLDDAFGVEKGLMTTVHAYTGDQMLVDGPHKDLRRARAAAVNIVPSSTGAARATALVLASMKGKLDGQSLRVPIPDGSITDFTGILGRDVTVEEVNAAFEKAATKGKLSKVLAYSADPLVSSDVVGSPYSCTYDSDLTMVMGNMVKVFGWYDNEWGYSNRLVDLVVSMGKKIAK
jgi:glyceraldehyde 3-phosphate dehydrogenase